MIEKRRTSSGTLRYNAKVYIGLAPSGKCLYKRGPARDTRAKAAEDEASLKALAERRYITDSSSRLIFFEDAVDLFKASAKYIGYSARTKKDFDYWMDKELKDVFGHARLSAIKTNIIERWVDDMDDRMKPATWVKPFGFMKNIILYAKRNGGLTFNPFEGIETPALQQKGKALRTDEELVVWDPEQIKSFLSFVKAKNDYLYPMLLLSFSLALRPGEVCGLKVKDIGPDYLRISQGLSRDGDETNLKTLASHRTLPISSDIHSLLVALTYKSKPTDYVFYNLKKNPVTPDVYGKRFKKMLKMYNKENKVQLPDMSLYKARHSWSTNAKFVYGMDPAIRAAMMGHTSINTSDENYTKVSREKIAQEMVWYA